MDDIEMSVRELIGDAREVHGVTESENVPPGKPLVDTRYNRLLYKPEADKECYYWELSNVLDGENWDELE